MPFTYIDDIDQTVTETKPTGKKYTYIENPEDTGTLEDIWEQRKKIPMTIGGMPGDIEKSLHEQSKRAFLMSQGMPSAPEFEGMQYIIPQGPSETSEQIGERLGYKGAKTVPGRLVGATISGAASAAPALIAGPAGLTAVGSAAAGGLAGQAAREVGAPEPLAIATDILTMIASAPGVAGAISKYGKEQVSNVLSKFGKTIPEFEKTAQLAEEAKLGQVTPFGKKPSEAAPIIPSKVTEEARIPTDKTSAIAKKELAQEGPTSALMETKRSISPE